MRPATLHMFVDQLAQLQAGHVATWQLVPCGLTKSEVQRLASRMGWRSVHRGVWRLPGVGRSPEGDTWAAILLVATREARNNGGGGPCAEANEAHHAACRAAAATGITGAWLLGVVVNPPSIPQLLMPHEVQRRHSRVRVVRTRAPIPTSEMCRGVPVVPPVRMLWDAGWIMREERDAVSRMCRWMSAADGLRLVEAERLYEVVRDPRAFGLPGVVPEPFRAAAFMLSGGHSHSGTEHAGRTIVTEVATRLGLAVEPRPFALGPAEQPVAEADIAIPLIKLDIEIDGPHHDEPEQQRKDRWRDDQVLALGWIVRRFKAQWVTEDPERFRRAVEAEIRRAAAAAGITLAA